RQNRVAPGGNQTADPADQKQIQQPDHAGYPAADHSHAHQPDAGPGPEIVTGENVRQIGADQPDQGRHRKVDEHGVNGVSAYGHLAGDGFGHALQSPDDRGIRARAGRLTRWTAACSVLFLAGCGGPYSALSPAGPSAADAAALWWGMSSFAVLVLMVVVALWLYALRRRPREIDE